MSYRQTKVVSGKRLLSTIEHSRVQRTEPDLPTNYPAYRHLDISQNYGLFLEVLTLAAEFSGLRDIINFFESLRGHVAQLASLDM